MRETVKMLLREGVGDGKKKGRRGKKRKKRRVHNTSDNPNLVFCRLEASNLDTVERH